MKTIIKIALIVISIVLVLWLAIRYVSPSFQSGSTLADSSQSDLSNIMSVSKGSDNYSTLDSAARYNSSNVPDNAQDIKNTTRKIVKNADIVIEVRNADENLDKILTWAKQNKGFEFNRSISSDGRYKTVSLVVKIDPKNLAKFVDYINSLGKIKSSNITSDDITDQYYDAAARLENFKRAREQYLQILRRAQKINDILSVQEKIDEVTGEIEVLEGRINLWNQQVEESTVNIQMNEEVEAIKNPEQMTWKFSSLKDIMTTMKNGFIVTTSIIVNSIIWIIIALFAISPLLIVVGIIIAVIWYLRKRKKM